MAKASSSPHVTVINGPNLNLLGQREPHIYGTETLADIERKSMKHGADIGLTVEFFQSNSEGALIDLLHKANATSVAAVLNAGGYSHTSVALHDAIVSIDIPVIEAHLSNIHAREAFREKSLTGRAAKGVICGFGSDVYLLALDAVKRLNHNEKNT
ncbi:MAG: type II 3-dehydroquinate dehydratase [Pseudomonadota bacterium]